MAEIIDVEKLKQELRTFVAQRDWDKFHNPKNIAMALTCESAELLEIFQWLSASDAAEAKNDPVTKEKASHELADILVYAIRLADLMEIDLPVSIKRKLEINNEKYPVHVVKGSAKKYTEYK